MTTSFDGEESNTLFNSLEEGGQGVFSLMVDPRQVVAFEAEPQTSPLTSFQSERAIRVGQELRVDIRPDSVSPKAHDVTVVWSNGYEGTAYQVQPEDVGTELYATARFAGQDMRPLEIKIECGSVLVGPPPVIDVAQIVIASDAEAIQELVPTQVGVSPSAFSQPVDGVTVDWLRDGIVFASESDIPAEEDGSGYFAEFTPLDDFGGSVLSVRITGHSAGCEDAVVTVNAGLISKGREIALRPETVVRVNEPRVAEKSKVKIDPVEFDPVPERVTYQWMINGAAIEGATTAKFRPRARHRGRQLSVLVAAERHGYLTTAVDVFLGVVAPGYEPEYYGEAPRIKGKAKVDGTLRVANLDRDLFDPAPKEIEYQWMRAKDQIPGARGKTYVPTAQDQGHKVWARVYAKLDGHRTQMLVTDKVRIK